MNEHTSVTRGQATATATATAKTRAPLIVRLMLRCPRCKEKSLCVGKSTGEQHQCPACGTRFAMR